MTPQQKNELVARKLGWDCIGGAWRYGNNSPFPIGHNPLPDYCSDIKAAWGIVDFAHSKGYMVNLKRIVLDKDLNYSDEQRLHSYEVSFIMYCDNAPEFSVSSSFEVSTAPEAIVDAFLKMP